MTFRVLGPGEVAPWLAAHARTGARTGVHISGFWGAGTGDVTGVALATADGEGGWFAPEDLDPADEQAVAAWLADESAPKALHDAKGPTLAFAARGWELRGVTSDTALSAYLAMPDQRSYDLADLALRYLRRELRAEEGDGGGQLAFGLDGGDDTAAAESDVLRARAVLRAGRRPRHRAGRTRRPPSCCATSSCRWSACWPAWSAPASRSTPSTWRTWSRSSAVR